MQKKSKIEKIQYCYEKSRRVLMLWHFLRKDMIQYLSIVIVLSVIMAFLYVKKTFYIFPFIFIYFAYVIYKINNSDKKLINKILKKRKKEIFFNDKTISKILKPTILPIFKYKIYNAKYTEFLYFEYLIYKSKLDKKELIELYTYFKFTTKDYKKITERSSFATYISIITSVLTASIFVIIQKQFKDKELIILDLFYTSFGVILFLVLFTSIVYKVIPLFERDKTKKENIKILLEYVINDKNE